MHKYTCDKKKLQELEMYDLLKEQQVELAYKQREEQLRDASMQEEMGLDL